MPRKIAYNSSDESDEQSSEYSQHQQSPQDSLQKNNQATNQNEETNYQPTQKLMNIVRQYNVKKQQRQCRQILGSKCCIGQEIECLDLGIYPQQICILNKQIKQMPAYISQAVYSKQKMQQLVFKLQNKNELRILTLYFIMFDFQSCMFKFEKDSDKKIQIVQSQKCVGKQKQKNYIKDWFQWVLNQQEAHTYINLPSSTTNKLLALRKTEQLAKIMLQNNKYEQAEFLSNIEDENYRICQMPTSLETLFMQMSHDIPSFFKTQHWIIKMAVYLWYYDGEQIGKFIEQFLKQGIQIDQEQFEVELYFMLVYYRINRSDYQPGLHDQSSKLALYWLLSEKLYEKNIIKLKQKTKYLLLKNLFKNYSTQRDIQMFLETDIYLKQNQHIARRLVSNSIHNIHFRSHSFHQSSNQIIKQYRQISYLQRFYEDGNSISYLQKVSQYLSNYPQSENRQYFLKKIQTIFNQQQILGNQEFAKLKSLYQKLQILMNIKPDLKGQILWSYRYLGLSLGKHSFQFDSRGSQIDVGQIVQVFNYIGRLEKGHKIMSDKLFDRIIHNSQAINLIKNNQKLMNTFQQEYKKDEIKRQEMIHFLHQK